MVFFLGGLFGGIASGVLGGLGKLFGGGNKPGMVDTNLYAMNKGQRQGLADMHYGMQGQLMAGASPARFWGGNQEAWTTGGLGVNAKQMRNAIFGGGIGGGMFGGGGGGGGATGYGARGYGATGYGAKADKIDLGADIYQLKMADDLYQNMAGRNRRLGESMAAEQTRRIEDERRLAGDNESDAASQWMKAQGSRQFLSDAAENTAMQALDWSLNAADRQHGARATNAQLGTQANIATAQNKTQASIATAGNRTSASIASAGNRTSASMANASNALGWANLRQQGAGMLLGARAADEDRQLSRFGFLHNAAQDWTSPNAQQTPYMQESGFSRAMSGFGAGVGLFQGMRGAFGNSGGTPSYPGGGYSGQMGGGGGSGLFGGVRRPGRIGIFNTGGRP